MSDILRLLVICVAVLGAAIGNARAADRVRATIPQAGTIPYAMYAIALAKGYFASEGLDVQLVVAGGGVATPALISGDVQFTGSPGAAIPALLKGAKLKIIMVTEDRSPFQLWADQSIRTLQELKGKQIGVVSRGDTSETSVKKALSEAGVDPSSMGFSAVSFPQGRALALLNGALPAAALPFDEVLMVAKSPNLHLLADMSRTVAMVTGGVVTSDRFLTENRPVALRFMRGLMKGFRYHRANRTETIDLVATQNPNVSRDVQQAIYDRELAVTATSGIIPEELAQATVDSGSELLGIAPDQRRKVADVFDFSLAKQANEELDASGWTPNP